MKLKEINTDNQALLLDAWFLRGFQGEYTIEKWSEHQADIYYNLLIDSCQEIANNLDLEKIMKE